MKTEPTLRPSDGLRNVRYEIRGKLARRAQEMERQGYEIISLNIGNPAAFGFRTPETMRLAMIENLQNAEGYCHQKGIFPAREAVVMQQQARGVHGVTAEDVFIGNGVSELIDLVLRALLNAGDEVLVPSPDYPLWTAAVTLNGGKAVHYPCRPENGFVPDPEEIAALVTARRAPSSSSTRTTPPAPSIRARCSKRIARIAGEHGLVVFSDEIYDQMTYDGGEFVPMATLVKDTLCATMSGLSKVYRACGYRVGWVVVHRRNEQRGRLLRRARAAGLAAPVQQRAGAVGRADRARRLPEHQGAGRARRAPVRVAPRHCRRRGGQPLPRRRSRRRARCTPSSA